MTYLVTGAAGFIGFHLAARLCRENHQVVGLDNVNDYYDVNLKRARLAQLAKFDQFSFAEIDLTDQKAVFALFEREQFTHVIHLAAQAGIHYGKGNPMAYVDSNLHGTVTVLEACRQFAVEHLIYASSSSVYGANTKVPFSTSDAVDHPLSLYAATKKSNELMAHSYSHLYNIPTTGLRFFTVYGPWGRPDMALFKFANAIVKGEPIKLFNRGDMIRDFTYVDDIVEGIMRIKECIPQIDLSATDGSASSSGPYKIFNIGNGNPVPLMQYLDVLEQALGKKAIVELLPMQPGEVYKTYADVEALFDATGYRPQTNVDQGVRQFVDWYKGYYG